jgi:phosphoribosylpyrophosphate synthetase
VREIYIMITHGLFTGQHWKELWSLGVKRIICTDTVPLPVGLDRSDIGTLSIVPLLRQQLLLGEDRTLIGATRSALDSVTEVVR